MNVYIWLILLTIFQITDGITTYIAVSNGIPEMNPILEYVMEQIGTSYGLIIPKAFMMLFAFLVIPKFWYSKVIKGATIFVTAVYFYIACSNTFYLIYYGV